MDQALLLCREAIDQDPANAVVRAIIGHVHAFVFRDFSTACEHHSLARQLSPGLPIVWDFSSMTALYTGQSELAYKFAKTGSHLGQFSPLKPYYDTSVMMCASATGRHDEAIQLGENVLKKIPKILPVMRHLAGSFAMTGAVKASRLMMLEISKHDQDFTFDRIRDPTYPLIAKDSIELIEKAFEATGIDRPDQI